VFRNFATWRFFYVCGWFECVIRRRSHIMLVIVNFYYSAVLFPSQSLNRASNIIDGFWCLRLKYSTYMWFLLAVPHFQFHFNKFCKFFFNFKL